MEQPFEVSVRDKHTGLEMKIGLFFYDELV